MENLTASGNINQVYQQVAEIDNLTELLDRFSAFESYLRLSLLGQRYFEGLADRKHGQANRTARSKIRTSRAVHAERAKDSQAI